MWLNVRVAPANSRQGPAHPFVVALPTPVLSTLLNSSDDTNKDFVVLALKPSGWKGATATGTSQKPSFRPYEREILVTAHSDSGAGVGIPTDTELSETVVRVSELLAGLYGLRNGESVHVRRVSSASVALRSVVLLPIASGPSADLVQVTSELKQALLKEAHVVAQGGLILLSHKSRRRPSTGKNDLENTNHSEPNGIENHHSTGNGAPAPMWAGFLALQCSPVLQGILGPNTVVTISDDTRAFGNRSVLSDLRQVLMAGALPASAEDLMASSYRSPSRKPLMLSSFMLSPSSSTSLSLSRLSPQKSLSSSSLDTVDKQVMLDSLVAKRLETPIGEIYPPPSFRDITIEVGVTLNTLKALRIFSGHWISLTVPGSEVVQIGRIYALDPPRSKNKSNLIHHVARSKKKMESLEDFNKLKRSEDDHGIYIPPTLLFNLGIDLTSQKPVPIQVEDISALVNSTILGGNASATSSASSSAAVSNSNTPSGSPRKPPAPKDSNPSTGFIIPPISLTVAKEAYIARVTEPGSSRILSCRNALRTFFSQPRVFRVGDVFAVVVKRRKYFDSIENLNGVDFDDDDEDDEDDSTEETKSVHGESADELEEEEEYTQELAYFKVSKVTPSPTTRSSFVIIDRKKSTLFQEGAVNSRIPSTIESFLLGGKHNIAPDQIAKFPELSTLMRPCLHPLSAQLGLSLSVLIAGRTGSGKSTIANSLATAFGIHIQTVNCFNLIGQADPQTEAKLKQAFKDAAQFVPCILLLRNVDAFDKAGASQDGTDPAIANALKDCIQSTLGTSKTLQQPFIVIGTTTSLTEVSKTIRSAFRHEVALEMPDEKQRFEALQFLTSDMFTDQDVSIQDIALRTASFSPRDLMTMVDIAGCFALQRIVDGVSSAQQPSSSLAKGKLRQSRPSGQAQQLEADVCSAGISVTAEDFDKAIHHLQLQHATSLGTPKIPNVRWDDVGGLLDAKKEILDTIQLPLQHPELFNSGIHQRSGILLFGPPGTGKTLLAKAIATECNLNFISVKGPELINMYVGESERNVREVFQRARDARPCVIFFDELDSLAPNRGKSGDSGGVMDRIVSQLLAELSAMNTQNDVFVIGATNRPDLIDPALLVPGRFDKLLYLGVNMDQKSRENIVIALTRKFHLGSTVDIAALAETCPGNLTGADLYALCSDALLIAIRDQVDTLEKGDEKVLAEYKKQDTSVDVQVEQRHFLEALEKLTPSVSFEELQRYQELAAKFTKKKK